MDSGPGPIDDPVELAQVRRQALKVHILAVAWAAVLTAAVWLL
jgi:hypothetical protein